MAGENNGIKSFSGLGDTLNFFIESIYKEDGLTNDDKAFHSVIKRAHLENGWFDEASIINALKGIAIMLNEKELAKWFNSYESNNHPPQKIGLILAGNLPFVGFHDIFCALASGNEAYIKISSKDGGLTEGLMNFISSQIPSIADKIRFVERLNAVDAVIATGSNNSQRYFEQYFGKKPHIFRKNRNGVAVLTGEESEQDLLKLADDILLYYGLGCRNVSKLYLPKGFDLNKIFKAVFDKYESVAYHKKYMNNFDYQKAILVMNGIDILENGLIILQENEALCSPVSVCYYEYYSDLKKLSRELKSKNDSIQCIVSKSAEIENTLPFGESQYPKINDYADGVDTMAFLSKI